MSMSLLNKAQTFVQIFKGVRAKNQAQRLVCDFNDELNRAEKMKTYIDGLKNKRKPKLENGITTGYAGTGFYSNGVFMDDD